MATVAPTGTGGDAAVEVRDNGTIFNAGNVAAGGPITSVVTLRDAAKQTFEDISAVGSKVVANDGTGAATTDRAGVTNPVSAGTIAYNAGPTEWIIRGGNVATTIGGVANTVLVSAGSDIAGAFTATRDNLNHSILAGSGAFANSAHTYDVTARPSTNITPNFTREAGGGTYTLNNTDGTVAVTSEIIPSKSVPGELTYRFGAPNPTTDEYKPKDVKET
jgi:hypothetical protein